MLQIRCLNFYGNQGIVFGGFFGHFINNKSYNLGIAFRQPNFLILLYADKDFCE